MHAQFFSKFYKVLQIHVLYFLNAGGSRISNMTFPSDMVDMEMVHMDMVDMDMVNMDMVNMDMMDEFVVNFIYLGRLPRIISRTCLLGLVRVWSLRPNTNFY